MVGGLLRGLDHEDAARFSFLLATPIILAAGLYKLPDLLGPLGDGDPAQMLVGSIAPALAAYGAVRFLVRWFTTRTLTPFAVYCLIAGSLAVYVSTDRREPLEGDHLIGHVAGQRGVEIGEAADLDALHRAHGLAVAGPPSAKPRSSAQWSHIISRIPLSAATLASRSPIGSPARST